MPAAAYPLDESSLRPSSTSSSPANHLPLGFGIETNVAHNDLAQQFCLNELADSFARHSGVISDHGEIALTLAHDLVMMRSGAPTAMNPQIIKLAPSGIVATA